MPHDGEDKKKEPEKKGKEPSTIANVFKAVGEVGAFLSSVSPGGGGGGGGGGAQMLPARVGGAPPKMTGGPSRTLPTGVVSPGPQQRPGHPALQTGFSFPTKQARTGAIVAGAMQNLQQIVGHYKQKEFNKTKRIQQQLTLSRVKCYYSVTVLPCKCEFVGHATEPAGNLSPA